MLVAQRVALFQALFAAPFAPLEQATVASPITQELFQGQPVGPKLCAVGLDLRAVFAELPTVRLKFFFVLMNSRARAFDFLRVFLDVGGSPGIGLWGILCR